MGSRKSSAPTDPDEPTGPSTVVVRGDAPPAAQDIRDTIVVKQGDLFLLADLEGNVPRHNPNGLGLYHQDTRFLSAFELSIEGLKPTILLSGVRAHFLSSQVLTNPTLVSEDGQLVHEQTIQVRRHRRLHRDGMNESLYLQNFNQHGLRLELSFHIDADFADMFHIRGLVREPPPGQREPVAYADGALALAYRGKDGSRRCTTVRFSPAPDRFEDGVIWFDLALDARGSRKIDISVEIDDGACPIPRGRAQRMPPEQVRIRSSSGAFDVVLGRAREDLRMLMSGQQEPFLAAGTPWYATLFGRDTLIAALQELWVTPALAKGTLRLLAHHQGTRDDPWRDEEPGKILHELRRGELARCGEIPFAPYFGTVDATPLWVVLLGDYYRVTADLELLQELRPNLEAALRWIDVHGDLDGDGFVEYRMRSTSGLVNQGWKDSWDGIVHADGSLPEAPIALIEVQAYVYAAKRRAARLFAALGEPNRAVALDQQAARLAAAIDDAFWMEEHGVYAMALDGQKRQVGSVGSNAGHALWCRVPSAERAARIAHRLMDEDMYSGWGIRTLSSREARYNPAGYHVGTVWPHDNSLIGLGFARYGHTQLLVELVTGLMAAARAFPDNRMPELFCGYARSAFGEPVRYPVACSPQAWAAASWSALLQGLLGIRIDAPNRELRIRNPTLPPWLRWVCVDGLKIGEAEVDLRYERVRDRAAVDVTGMRGDVRVAFVADPVED